MLITSCLDQGGGSPFNLGPTNAVQQESEISDSIQSDLDGVEKPFDMPVTIAKGDELGIDATKLAIIGFKGSDASIQFKDRDWFGISLAHASMIVPTFTLQGITGAAPADTTIVVNNRQGQQVSGQSEQDGSFSIDLSVDMIDRVVDIGFKKHDSDEMIPVLRGHVTMDGRYSFKISPPDANVVFRDIGVFGDYVFYNQEMGAGNFEYRVMRTSGGHSITYGRGPTSLLKMDFFLPKQNEDVPAKLVGVTDDANLGMALPFSEGEDTFFVLNDFKNGDYSPTLQKNIKYDFAIHAANPGGRFSLYSPNLEGDMPAAMYLVPLEADGKDLLLKDKLANLATKRWVTWSSKSVLWALNEITKTKSTEEETSGSNDNENTDDEIFDDSPNEFEVIERDIDKLSDVGLERDYIVDDSVEDESEKDLNKVLEDTVETEVSQHRYVVNRYDLSQITDLGPNQISSLVKDHGPIFDANQQIVMVTEKACRKIDVTSWLTAKVQHYVIECKDENGIWQAVLGNMNDAIVLTELKGDVSNCTFNKTGEMLACSVRIDKLRWGIRLYFLPTEKAAWLIPPQSIQGSSMFAPKFSKGKDPFVISFLEQDRTGVSVNVVNLKHHPFFKKDILYFKDQETFDTSHYFESGRYESISVQDQAMPVFDPELL